MPRIVVSDEIPQDGNCVYDQWLPIWCVPSPGGQPNCKFDHTKTHIHFVNVIHM